MANLLNIEHDKKIIKQILRKGFQSGHLNFMLGSGASSPAISTAGNIESEIDSLLDAEQPDEAAIKLHEFLESIQPITNELITDITSENVRETLNQYYSFLAFIQKVLVERKTSLLPKQANVFTTNYDLFIEKAIELYPALNLNDGFNRIAGITNQFTFSTKCFFNSTFNNGNLFSYKVEIPSINLLKLHGSFSWKKSNGEISYSVKEKTLLPELTPEEKSDSAKLQKRLAVIKTRNSDYALIVPSKNKHNETLMERTYYDLLRLYANELDKENVLLVVFGFSFADDHIFEITKRALKNPTLKMLIFSYSESGAQNFISKFQGFNNIDVIAPLTGNKIDFSKLNQALFSTFELDED